MPEKIKTEAQEQSDFIAWFKKRYPSTLIFSHIDGATLGGKDKFAMIASLKKQGWINGVPDIQIPEWNVWIEMKRSKGGKVSDFQKDTISKLIKAGQKVFICNGSQSAKEAVLGYEKDKISA